MAALDPRRRPVLATMAYAATMFVVLGRLLSTRAAFAPLVPGVSETVVAFVLVLVAAVIGATVARRLSDSLAPPATAKLGHP